MKNKYTFLILLILVFSVLTTNNMFGQGATCATADPFCSENTYTFPNSTGTSAEGGNDYGCLSTQPNPAWYYMQIGTSGSIGIDISQVNNSGAGIDVDYILYGPFPNLATALGQCGDLGNPGGCSGDHNCSGEAVDCSYDPASTEWAEISGNTSGNAVAGQVYLMLLTNFSNQPGQITFEQTSGSGSTDCSILFPPSCGSVDFHAEENFAPYNIITPFPSTMTCEDDWIYLVANDSATSGGYITPALHFEFTPTNDPNDYVNIYSGGSGALGSGTLLGSFNLNDGTILTIYGEYLSPSSNYYFEICDESNVDWTVYDGGLGTIYGNGNDASGNGCTRFGPYSPAGTASWASNAPAASIGANDAGLMYFDPVVAGPGTYNFQYTWNNGAGCVDSELKTITVTNPYSFTSLTYTTVCKSAGGTANATLTATSGGTYSSATLGASLNTATGAVNIATAPVGTHTVNYSVGTMPCGATGSGSITILPDVDPSWTPPAPVCANGGNVSLNPLITGTAGGSWSGTGVSGTSFNPSGLSGNISITYTVGTAPCQETSVQNINVIPDVNPSWTNPSPVCESGGTINLNTLITGTAGGTWSGTGVSGSTFDPSGLSGNMAVTYTVGTAPCQESSLQNINVTSTPDASWTTPGTICEAAGSINLNLLITGTAGGTWSGTGVSGNTFNPVGLSGAIAVTYTVGGASCQDVSVQNITVNPNVNPAWTSPGTICESAGNINLNLLITGTAGGTWSGTGVTGNTFNPTGLSGAISITYSVGSVPCVETSIQNITVNPDVNPSWTSPGTICESAGSLNLNLLITGTAGGTWSGTGVTGNTFNPTGLSGAISVTYSVGSVPCVETSAQNITVNPDVNPAWTSPGTVCESAGSINLNLLITGTAGGTWSGTGVTGNTFNPTGLSGAISITYSVGLVPCVETSIQNITVSPDVNPSWTSPGSVCEVAGSINLNTLITGTSGGSWSGTGVTGSTFDPTGLTGAISITYSVGTAPCIEISAQNITVTPDPIIGITTASECENISGSGQALNIDVTGLNTAINASGNITWFTDNTYVTPYNPTNETVDNGEIFYFEVEINGCIVQGTITYSVSGNIVLNDPTPEFCEDILGGGSVANVDLTTFNNSVFAGATSYTWATGPTGVTINNGDSINVQVQQGSCPIVDIYVHFTVNPLPTATISGGGTICAGDAIPDATITLTGNGPWSVTYTDGTTPVTINPVTSPVTLSGLADGTYTITAVSDANCTGTFSGTATILTNPLPTATISGGGTICTGDAIPDITITLIGNSPWSVTYTDGTTPVTINPVTSPVTLSGLADGTYTITAVSDANCTGTFSGTATILTNPLPTAINQTPQVCEDVLGGGTASNVDLTGLNSLIDGGTGTTLTWYNDTLLTSPVATPTSTTVSNGQVFYVEINNGTCTTIATVTYDVTSTITLNAQTPSLCEDAVGSGSVANVDLTSYNTSIYSGGAIFDWYQDAGLTTPVVTPTATTVTNGLTLYVDVTDGTCNNNSTITFTVNPLPVVILPSGGMVCEGSTTNLTPSSGGIWVSSDTTVATIDNSGLVTGISSGTATMVFTDSTTGCSSNVASGLVTVNPLPIITIPSSGVVCEGSTINLTPSTGGTWISSDSTVATIDNTGLVTGISGGTATMVFTDGTTGCSSNFASGLVTVNPMPIVNVPSGGLVCEGATLNLTPTTGGIWTSSDPTVATIDNTGLVTGASAGIANMMFTDSITGCSSNITSGLVTVNPLPVVILPSGGMVCEGSTINLTPTTGGMWTSSDTTIATIDNSGLVTGILAGTSTVVFTDATTGCSSNVASGLVTVNPIPTVAVTSGGVVCAGSTINFTPSTGGTWITSDPTVATIDNTGLVTGVSVGTANMVFTDATTGCSSTIASGLVVVGGVTAVIGATPSSGFMPLDVVFSNGSTTGLPITYTWNFGDGSATSNQFEPTHTYTDLGNYNAVLIVTDGVCSDTATVVIEVIGQSSILIPNVFTPNGDGSNDVFTVDGTNLESVEGQIFNRWGQKMYSWNHVKGYWDGRTQSGIEAPDGTYFYIISAKGLDGEEYFKKGGFSLIR